jgi:hypothetical protein
MLDLDASEWVSIVALDGKVAWKIGCVGSDDLQDGGLRRLLLGRRAVRIGTRIVGHSERVVVGVE